MRMSASLPAGTECRSPSGTPTLTYAGFNCDTCTSCVPGDASEPGSTFLCVTMPSNGALTAACATWVSTVRTAASSTVTAAAMLATSDCAALVWLDDMLAFAAATWADCSADCATARSLRDLSMACCDMYPCLKSDSLRRLSATAVSYA